MNEPISFETLLASLSEIQRRILRAIWNYHYENKMWIPTGTLHHQFGKATVQTALDVLGGTVVWEVSDAGKKRYQLKWLGILLSLSSDGAEELLTRFLNHLKELYQDNPEFERVTSQDLEGALGLTKDQTSLLEQLIRFSPFYGGGSFGESGWTVQPPENIDDFPEIRDFGAYVRRRAMDGYSSTVPIGERQRLIYQSEKESMSGHLVKQMTKRESDVFIVHGRDEAAKEAVARFIEQLGLHSVVLHEMPNGGRTIIEKFEEYSNVGFAVVLLTPDDIGASPEQREQMKPRARQNVILELGYFLGKLGRNRVCLLYKEGVEIPSDYHGVLYVPMDTGNGWRLELAKELKHAGFKIDMNTTV